MRKQQKSQMEDMLKLLRHAHDEIEYALGKGNLTMGMSLLADCQNGALALGNLIEEIEGEIETISFLEEYCELLYQIYQELEKRKKSWEGKETGRKANAKRDVQSNDIEENSLCHNKIHKRLKKAYDRIAISIKNDIKVRQEIVFLPYKASMWDSLESVWKAAEEDPECDVYVVPIPYYDKNPDGSFRELYYEGDRYPAYVSVTRYDDYDFAKRQPDVIFIHNPYDECNYVTSVHPFFYSNNLKRFTKKLVYIPYFILEEINPESVEERRRIAHFCMVPGVFNSDKVIVQSETMRKAYIYILLEATKGQGFTRRYWEEKILGLGSPKIDKVIRTTKKDLDVPADWQKIISTPDGTMKKIVFYNNTISALLQYDEDMIIKMKSVFAVFKRERDEIALLWRPHPLIESTLKCMRPHLWDAYNKIRNDYLSEAWGIYDDTSDVDRAIVLSDAYYGDMSSVVQMYKRTGKPIMIQNVRMRDKSYQEGYAK